MTDLKMCPVCGEGFLRPRSSTNVVKICGQEYEIPFYFAVCNHCESEVADAEDAAKNKDLMIEIRSRVEQEMSEKANARSNDK